MAASTTVSVSLYENI